MSRDDIFEIIFDINPNFVIAEVVLRKINKRLGIMPPLSEDWKPWEEQNCCLKKEDK